MVGLVATNYSQALFELAKEEKKLEDFKSSLITMQDVLQTSEELRLVMKHPKISKDDKKELLDKIFTDIDIYVKNFAKLLVDKNRFMNFNDICKCYFSMYNEYHNIEVAYVQSAVELSSKQKQALKVMLETKLNKTVELKMRVNEELLAGMRIKIKDEILDNSAASKLDRMKEQVVKTTL